MEKENKMQSSNHSVTQETRVSQKPSTERTSLLVEDRVVSQNTKVDTFIQTLCPVPVNTSLGVHGKLDGVMMGTPSTRPGTSAMMARSPVVTGAEGPDSSPLRVPRLSMQTVPGSNNIVLENADKLAGLHLSSATWIDNLTRLQSKQTSISNQSRISKYNHGVPVTPELTPGASASRCTPSFQKVTTPIYVNCNQVRSSAPTGVKQQSRIVTQYQSQVPFNMEQGTRMPVQSQMELRVRNPLISNTFHYCRPISSVHVAQRLHSPGPTNLHQTRAQVSYNVEHRARFPVPTSVERRMHAPQSKILQYTCRTPYPLDLERRFLAPQYRASVPFTMEQTQSPVPSMGEQYVGTPVMKNARHGVPDQRILKLNMQAPGNHEQQAKTLIPFDMEQNRKTQVPFTMEQRTETSVPLPFQRKAGTSEHVMPGVRTLTPRLSRCFPQPSASLQLPVIGGRVRIPKGTIATPTWGYQYRGSIPFRMENRPRMPAPYPMGQPLRASSPLNVQNRSLTPVYTREPVGATAAYSPAPSRAGSAMSANPGAPVGSARSFHSPVTGPVRPTIYAHNPRTQIPEHLEQHSPMYTSRQHTPVNNQRRQNISVRMQIPGNLEQHPHPSPVVNRITQHTVPDEPLPRMQIPGNLEQHLVKKEALREEIHNQPADVQTNRLQDNIGAPTNPNGGEPANFRSVPENMEQYMPTQQYYADQRYQEPMQYQPIATRSDQASNYHGYPGWSRTAPLNREFPFKMEPDYYEQPRVNMGYGGAYEHDNFNYHGWHLNHEFGSSHGHFTLKPGWSVYGDEEKRHRFELPHPNKCVRSEFGGYGGGYDPYVPPYYQDPSHTPNNPFMMDPYHTPHSQGHFPVKMEVDEPESRPYQGGRQQANSEPTQSSRGPPREPSTNIETPGLGIPRGRRDSDSGDNGKVGANGRDREGYLRERQFNVPKTLTYDGTGKWRSFQIKFTSYAEEYGWSDREKKNRLCWCLYGKASDFYSHVIERDPDILFPDLVRKFRTRFDYRDVPETLVVEFQTSEQRLGESLCEWGERVDDLAYKAYSDLPDDRLMQFAVVRFCQGLTDKEAGAFVANQRHQTFESAIDSVRLYQCNRQHIFGKEKEKVANKETIDDDNESESSSESSN